ncbi:ribosome biogenesis GTPase YlqF [Clostridium guangxiense]|uniref:ribosome biogenesis GTPase YlqF n=1 Tax=Clostridium guangxiense TaxID=1662055 RepID=UPI001E2F9392|nr:ribosome biogenesis GTPase YlqF [Clostridium guangxiense]MCD2345989.1 ribosome biogenesis GTPase YlqF [Clostridium guangxiense]
MISSINWFPGHMAKTRREITENLKLVDAVIEIRDSRIVKSSANPEIDKICANKPRLILLNKCDLAEDAINKQWVKYLSTDRINVLPVNCLNGKGLNKIKSALNLILKDKLERLKNKGIQNHVIRVMVVGIPNVGKSSFINKMAKNNIAKIGNKPGVTKSKQWIKTDIGIELMDTPGILWPKFKDENVGIDLAFTGAIKDEILDTEELALKLVEFLQKNYSEKIKQRYKLEEIYENPLENMENIARKRGALLKGGEIDYNRVSIMLLDEFRDGKLGNISLERP